MSSMLKFSALFFQFCVWLLWWCWWWWLLTTGTAPTFMTLKSCITVLPIYTGTNTLFSTRRASLAFAFASILQLYFFHSSCTWVVTPLQLDRYLTRKCAGYDAEQYEEHCSQAKAARPTTNNH